MVAPFHLTTFWPPPATLKVTRGALLSREGSPPTPLQVKGSSLLVLTCFPTQVNGWNLRFQDKGLGEIHQILLSLGWGDPSWSL